MRRENMRKNKRANRLEIREFREGDEIGIMNFFNDAVEKRNFPFVPRRSRITEEELQEWIKAWKRRDALTIVAESENIVIGAGTLRTHKFEGNRHVLEFSITIDPKYQGKGIGFTMLIEAIKLARKEGYKKVMLKTASKNIAMIKAAIKCDFSVEGVLKDHLCLYTGELVDVIVFGLRL